MPYAIGFLEDKGIVSVENIGRLRYRDFVEQIQQVLELGRVKNTRLFLLDCTRLIAQATASQVFDFPALYERAGVPRNSKVAILMSKDAATKKDIEFYETVCLNRGWQVRVFSDKYTAMGWLLGYSRA